MATAISGILAPLEGIGKLPCPPSIRRVNQVRDLDQSARVYVGESPDQCAQVGRLGQEAVRGRRAIGALDQARRAKLRKYVPCERLREIQPPRHARTGPSRIGLAAQ